MTRSKRTTRISVEQALAKLPAPGGKLSAEVFRRGDVEVKIYAPHGTDPQTPHTRDEIYFVAHGDGVYVCGDVRQPFGPGDFLFAPAGMRHRFEDFSDDLAIWVIFFGPEGGFKPEE